MNQIKTKENNTMNQEISTYSFNGNNIRVLGTKEQPMFVAKDVATILGYSDTQAMTRRLDPEDVGTCTDKSSGQVREVSTVSESGLYQSILGSIKPEAKVFKRWVTSEVLPSIRKHGAYATPATLSDTSVLVDAIAALRTEILAKELPPSTPLEAATKAADSELALRHSLWKKLGLKKIDRDVESIEVLRRIEHDHMVTGLVPASLANRVAKMDPTTKKVVETALSGKHVRPIRLAGLLGYAENTKNASIINVALCALALQMRHITNNNAFMPINAGVNIANVDDVGPHKGVLVGWEPVKTCEVLETYFNKNPAKAPKK